MAQWACVFLFVLGQFSQTNTGELRLIVTDPGGLPLPGRIELSSESSKIDLPIDTDAHGQASARRLPFGRYRVSVVRSGFTPFSALVEIHSALPLEYPVVLSVAAVQTQVTVSATDTLLDLGRTGAS